jgi:hypothetical protein
VEPKNPLVVDVEIVHDDDASSIIKMHLDILQK